MKKFEYKRIYREVGYRELDMIGEAGWELVAVQPSTRLWQPDGNPVLAFFSATPACSPDDFGAKIARKRDITDQSLNVPLPPMLETASVSVVP